jgi:hypothetical protein
MAQQDTEDRQGSFTWAQGHGLPESSQKAWRASWLSLRWISAIGCGDYVSGATDWTNQFSRETFR